ncbi:hypothetical protein N7501_012040 [Penicillium viridicatum]|nr:hypothetical protein N7501_012040 [Penicillium viridicatum]
MRNKTYQAVIANLIPLLFLSSISIPFPIPLLSLGPHNLPLNSSLKSPTSLTNSPSTTPLASKSHLAVTAKSNPSNPLTLRIGLTHPSSIPNGILCPETTASPVFPTTLVNLPKSKLNPNTRNPSNEATASQKLSHNASLCVWA